MNLTPEQVKQERQDFEAWIREQEGHPFAGQFSNLMWKAWQARAALLRSAGDGWQDIEKEEDHAKKD